MVQNLENEIWEIHPKYDWYAASNLGRIKSLERNVVCSNGRVRHYDERLIKPYSNDEDYLRFNISKNGKIIDRPLVHRFVYECFHKYIIPDDLEINHKNCKRDSNFIENLELLDHQSNVDYSISKTVGQYTLDGKLVKIWKSTMEAGRNRYTQQAVSACCNGKRKKHKGFIWKYI